MLVYRVATVRPRQSRNPFLGEDNGVPTRRLIIEKGKVVSAPQQSPNCTRQHSIWPRSIYYSHPRVPSIQQSTSSFSDSKVHSAGQKHFSNPVDLEAQQPCLRKADMRSVDHLDKPFVQAPKKMDKKVLSPRNQQAPSSQQYRRAICESIQKAYLGPSRLREGVILTFPTELAVRPLAARGSITKTTKSSPGLSSLAESSPSNGRKASQHQRGPKRRQHRPPRIEISEKQMPGQSFLYSVTSSETTGSSMILEESSFTYPSYTLGSAQQISILQASVSCKPHSPVTTPRTSATTDSRLRKALPPSPALRPETEYRSSILSALSSPATLAVNRMSL